MPCVRPIEFKSLFARYQPVAATAALYPQLRLLATRDFPVGYALVGVQLTTSLINYGTPLAGIVLVVGQTALSLSISNELQQITSHVTQQNSIVGAPNIPIPTSKCTSDSFGLFAYPMTAGAKISLYGFADATAGNDLFALASFKLARLK